MEVKNLHNYSTNWQVCEVEGFANQHSLETGESLHRIPIVIVPDSFSPDFKKKKEKRLEYIMPACVAYKILFCNTMCHNLMVINLSTVIGQQFSDYLYKDWSEWIDSI